MEKRFNVFNQIHKGLRHILYDTAAQLQKADFSSPEMDSVVSQLEQVLFVFDEHAEHEDKYILPHVLKHAPEMVASFEEDHITDHKLSADLNEHVAAWKNATSKEAKHIAGNRIYYAFNDFIAFNLYHMNKEENELLFTLWQHHTDAEIMQMQVQIISSIPPEIMMIEATWMMRAINNAEIINWMAGVKMTAPEPMYNALEQIAVKELPAERWNNIKAVLYPAAAVA